MDMVKSTRRTGGYLLAAAFGAFMGGAAVLVVSKALPKMMSGMMRNMMEQMGDEGCDPADI
jgi:hypothetical protein